MAFGFYHSMVTIPSDMQEAASIYGLTRWQRFHTVELPASAHSLIWNSMLSFGGGWFFVVQSEAISVMNKDIKLPGLGSYMARPSSGDNRAAFWAVVAMVVLILASDQLVLAPAPCLGGQVQDRADGVGHARHLVGVRPAARRLPVHLAPDARLATADGQAPFGS